MAAGSGADPVSGSATGPALVVFGGLPGVGKTSISRRVADRLGATFLRIDTIEAAIVSTLATFEGNPVGYVVAGRVAADQLRAGRTVVADAVNNVPEAREGWIAIARECGVPVWFIEVICSDAAEHRRRVEGRRAEMPGQAIPTWEQVRTRGWHPVSEPHLVLDNVGDPAAHAAVALDWLTGGGPTMVQRD